MASQGKRIKSVAIIGAGAAGASLTNPRLSILYMLIGIGAITAAALVAEEYYERVVVYERRETAGGTWYFFFQLYWLTETSQLKRTGYMMENLIHYL